MPPYTPASYGEPVNLRGNRIYFTSWKYVRQGNWHWQTDRPDDEPVDPVATLFLHGDGLKPSRFEPRNMPRGIRLRAQKAQKVPLAAGDVGRILTILQEGGRYRAWYVEPAPEQPESSSAKDRIMPGQKEMLAYAESEDGFHWEKPRLGLVELAGSRDNNIVFRGDVNGLVRGFHGGSVFVDPTSTEERYKMIHLGCITDAEWDAFARKYPGESDPMARRGNVRGYRNVSAVFGAVSPDGLRWKALPEPLMIQHADTQNTCYWDLDRRQYVAYVRAWQVDPQQQEWAGRFPETWIRVGRRCIGRSVSDDFRHFTKAELAVTPGADLAPSHLWYTNAKTTLPGCPDQHVMFPWRWELERDGGDCFLFSSADGWTWSQVPGGPVVECGPVGGRDGEYVVCGINLVELPGDRWGIPYRGHPIPHKYPGREWEERTGLFPGVPDVSGLACWEKGRLVALEADEGEFSTIGFAPPGDRIRLNASIRPAGFVRVEVNVLGRDNVPGRSFADCDPVIGNGQVLPVTWGGQENLNHGGAPILLRFRMRQAQLFGIEFC